jgi:two-component system, response regulator YesN
MRAATRSDDWDDNLLARVLGSFREAMKLEVRLFPLIGAKSIASLRGYGHPFCRAVRSSAQGRRNCLRDINRAVQLSIKTGEPYIFQCHADMIEFTAAVRDGDRVAAAFVCGPILLRHPDAAVERGIQGKAAALRLNRTALLKSLPDIPVYPERRVQAAADLLFLMASHFSKIDASAHRRQHEITHQQALLAGELLQKKTSAPGAGDAMPPPAGPRADLFKERELVDLIRIGDRKKARELLDEILGTALFRSHEHLGILKARALEIIFAIARVAVEAGANLEEILGFKYQYVQNLSRDDSQESLYYFLMKAFDQLFECIYQSRNIQHTTVFARAKAHIWKNYNQGVSLKNLALAVGISPYYLSHLFRKEMGTSFLEYLTSVRLSAAKSLLRQNNLSMMDICLEVGYQDPSHFAKIFKRKEGVHPTEYRKRQLEAGA